MSKIFPLETLVSVVLKKICIIFIYKHWHYNLRYCYFEEDKNSLFIFLYVDPNSRKI